MPFNFLRPTLPSLDRFEKTALVVGVVFCVLLGFTVQKLIDRSHIFGKSPDHTPYQLEPFNIFNVPDRAYNGAGGPGFAVVNYRGSPYPQGVRAGNPGILGLEDGGGYLETSLWQHNLDPEMVWARWNGIIYGGLDWNEDGREEVFYYARDEEGRRHRIACYDPLQEKLLGQVNLPAGPDHFTDGHWDGYYRPVGFIPFERADGTRTRALVVACLVQYDAYGRGVFAVDLERDTILWSHALASSPIPPHTLVRDLDGDGLPEIVVGTNAPANLNGDRVNGLPDDQSLLLVLDHLGQVKWARVTAPRAAATKVFLSDLDGDGTLEVITSCSSVARPYNEITIWNGSTGEFITRQTSPFRASHCYLMGLGRTKATNLLVSSPSLGLIVYQLDRDGIREIGRVPVKEVVAIVGTGDFMPIPGDEVLVRVRSQGYYLLDSKLNPLAVLGTLEYLGKFLDHWQSGPQLDLLMFATDSQTCLKILPRPWYGRIAPEPWGLASVLMLATTGSLVTRRRRRNIYRMRLDLEDPDILRELRLRLLSDLELSGHGAVGVLKGLRRLIWNLETRCAGMGHSPEMTARLEEHWDDFRESALPHVRDIIGLSEKVNIVPHVVANVREALDGLEESLKHLAATGFDGDTIAAVHEDLQNNAEAAEAGLQKIRREVEGHFRADWNEVWALVLRARAEDLNRAQVTVDYRPVEKGTCCRLDPKQLEFMLDNLVGNAVRAMAESPEPRLTIGHVIENAMVVCEVTDTGWGIAEEDWDRIMDTPYSSRKGGGLGLFETQRILRLFGGRIWVKESRPGVGTTLRMVVPLSRGGIMGEKNPAKNGGSKP